jgi:Tol biopolymer transport system component
MAADGGGVHPVADAPRVPLAQVSRTLGMIVYSKTLSSSSKPYSNCGFAGCTSGFFTNEEAGIAIANLDGSGEQLLTKGGYDTKPTFSPDGRQILYLQHRKGDDKRPVIDAVAIINYLGADIDSFVPPPRFNYDFPVWAPDGRSVAALRVGADFNEYEARPVVLALDHSPPRELATGIFRDLAWSPDGRRLAGVREMFDPMPSAGPLRARTPLGADLWVIPADGGPAVRVTRFARSRATERDYCGAYIETFGHMATPAWSPDSSQLAVLSSYNHLVRAVVPYDVVVLAADGTGFHVARAAPHATCDASHRPGETVELLGWTGGVPPTGLAGGAQ